MSKGLDLAALRAANLARLPEFRNGKGERYHTSTDGSEWLLSQWMNALTGEVGEAANIIKKIDRGDLSLEEARAALAKEFADILCYLDIVSMRAGVDLSKATVDKFNEVSARVESLVRLSSGFAYWLRAPGDRSGIVDPIDG